jgi:hypothetical protein
MSLNKRVGNELINFDTYTHKLSEIANISYEQASIDMKNKLKQFNKSNKKSSLAKLKNPAKEIYKHCKKNYIK